MATMISSVDRVHILPTISTQSNIAAILHLKLSRSLGLIVLIYFFNRERAVSGESYNLIGSRSGQYFPI